MKNEFNYPKKVYGLKLKDKEKQKRSQSGGAFTVIAEYFIQNGGVVYGCGMNDRLEAVYKRCVTMDDLENIKGSKYVQADIADSFKMIKDDLNSGMVVLFSGTPCYCAAVKNVFFFHPNFLNLYTCELICHGVPSPLIYRKYLEEKEGQTEKKIIDFIFREKNERGGWHSHVEKIMYDDGSSEITNKYTNLFYTNLGLRPSCGKCPYSKAERVSDFTIGDFWGVQKSFPGFDDNQGVSIVFCNNERALDIFYKIKSRCEVVETSLDAAMQPNLKGPSRIPKGRIFFWRDMSNKGALYCADKWPMIVEFVPNLKVRIKKLIKSLIINK